MTHTSKLLIGRTAQDTTQTSFGFSSTPNVIPLEPASTPVFYDQEGHLMTIAPTGAGKGVGCVAPALVHHQGSAVVLDMKGENYVMTARRRRDLGQSVFCLDPFAMVEGFVDVPKDEQAGFNPFDLLPYLADDKATACRILADMLLQKDGEKVDRFWRDSAVSLLAGLLSHYETKRGQHRSLYAIMEDLKWMPQDKPRFVGDISPDEFWESRLAHDIPLKEELEINDTPLKAIARRLVVCATAHKMSQTWEASDLKDRVQELFDQVEEKASTPEERRDVLSKMLNDLEQDDGLEAFLDEDILGWGISFGDDTFKSLLKHCEDYIHSQNVLGILDQHIQSEVDPSQIPLAFHDMAYSQGHIERQALSLAATAPDKTWGSMLSVLNSNLSQFTGNEVHKFLMRPMDFKAVEDGEDVSVYVAFPPTKIRSHNRLFSLMVDGLLKVVLNRTYPPETRTLFLLDEVAQLGYLDFLVTAQTLLRGYGVQVWSFWQDFSQIQAIYPLEWRTLLNNARVIQTFGRNMSGPTQEVCESLDISRHDILSLSGRDMLVWNDSPTPTKMMLPLCYEDVDLKDHCDTNPLYTPTKKTKQRREEKMNVDDLLAQMFFDDDEKQTGKDKEID